MDAWRNLIFDGTSLCNKEKGLANRRDYESFVEVAGGRAQIGNEEGFRADGVEIDGKTLVCVYDCVDP